MSRDHGVAPLQKQAVISVSRRQSLSFSSGSFCDIISWSMLVIINYSVGLYRSSFEVPRRPVV